MSVTHKEQTEETTKKKAVRFRLFTKILCVCACVLAIFIGITYSVTQYGLTKNMDFAESFDKVTVENSLSFDNYANGCWNITCEDEIRILQLTDIHIGGGWMSIGKDTKALNAVAAMVTSEKPDLVIFTGDMAYPMPFQSGTFNNLNGARLLAALMDTLGVNWTVVFGNHDSEAYSYYSRREISDFYENSNFSGCIYQAGPEEIDGFGNQVINLIGKNGLIKKTLILFDSHTYTDGDIFGVFWKYDNIHDNQIEWYKTTISELSARNSEILSTLPSSFLPDDSQSYETVKSFAFLHIPPEEYKTAWFEYVNNGREDTADVKYISGKSSEDGEVVFCGVHSDELFETMLELGSTESIFCGHDHRNYFSLDYKGIRLNYGRSIDYLAIPGIAKLGDQRGCTVIVIGSDGSFTIDSECYYQGKYMTKYGKETIAGMTAEVSEVN